MPISNKPTPGRGAIGTSIEDLLRAAAKRGDPLADAAVESFVYGVRPEDLLDYLHHTIRLPTRLHLDRELAALGENSAAREAFRNFLDTMSRPPAWMVPEQVAAGSDFFRRRVSAASLALASASLPTCYCWAPEAAVLMHTERLARDVPRRILETAQFVLDVMSPGGLDLGARTSSRGVRAVQKVRLMHAVVRFMLRNRETLCEAAMKRFQCDSQEELWAIGKSRNPWLGFLVARESAPTDDLAINQEQLAGTVLTFSIVVLQSFERVRIRVSREQQQSYLHAWKVVGYLLGVEEPLLEHTGNIEGAEALRNAIMTRHRRPSPHAFELTKSLSAYLADDIDLLLGMERWLPTQRIPRWTMRMLLESKTLDACGVALDRTDGWFYPPFRFLACLFGRLHNLPGVGALSTRLFNYLCKKVWAWRNVPFERVSGAAQPPAESVGLRLANWSATAQTAPVRTVHPGSTEDISRVMRNPARYPSPVRVMGSYHSTSPCVDADGGTVIRLDRLKRVLEVGADYVEAEAGALYVDVAHELYRRGLEFFVNLQIGNITMGAAACSTTKDGAFAEEFAQASSYCTAMTVVLADGTMRRIDEKTPELLQAARCAHGLLGVVCTVRFRVRSIVPVSIEHRNMNVKEFLQALPALKAGENSLQYYLYPFIDRVTVQIRRKTDPGGYIDRQVWRLRNFSVATVVPLAARLIGKVPGAQLRDAVSALFYRVSSQLLAWLCRAEKTYAFEQTTRYREVPGKYAFTFSLWGFAEDRFPQVLEEYIALVKQHYAQTGYRSHMLTVGYVVSQDANALLSYSSGGRTITIDPTGFGGDEWDRFLDAYNNFCSERGGIPLLNQTPRLTAEHARRAFGERLSRFERIRCTFDPEDRLLNPYFAGLLQDGSADV